METILITATQILAQTLTIDAGHVIDGLLLVVCFFIAMFIKEIKQTNKETHALFLDHEKRLTKAETQIEEITKN